MQLVSYRYLSLRPNNNYSGLFSSCFIPRDTRPLALSTESTLTVTDYTKDWAGNWIKFIGGQGTLKLEFIGDSEVKFEVPYLARDSSGDYSLTIRGSLFSENHPRVVYFDGFFLDLVL